MKYVLVGDMHVKRDNLDESKRLIEWIGSIGGKPIFMGDQHDSMGVVRAEVIEFWDWAYRHLPKSISLTGNHDLSSDGSASAMTAHKDITEVVTNEPAWVSADIAAIGYIRDNDTFVATTWDVYKKGAKYILCHAEFNGAQFENGFYSPHGIDVSKCPPAIFISGHIHKRQRIQAGQHDIRYIGTPRQLTRSDIGERKGVIVWDTETEQFTDMPTPHQVSKPFQHI